MAKLSFQCVLPYNTVASYLVPLLQLNLAGMGCPPEVKRQAKPITSMDMFWSYDQRDSSTL